MSLFAHGIDCLICHFFVQITCVLVNTAGFVILCFSFFQVVEFFFLNRTVTQRRSYLLYISELKKKVQTNDRHVCISTLVVGAWARGERSTNAKGKQTTLNILRTAAEPSFSRFCPPQRLHYEDGLHTKEDSERIT